MEPGGAPCGAKRDDILNKFLMVRTYGDGPSPPRLEIP